MGFKNWSNHLDDLRLPKISETSKVDPRKVDGMDFQFVLEDKTETICEELNAFLTTRYHNHTFLTVYMFIGSAAGL